MTQEHQKKLIIGFAGGGTGGHVFPIKSLIEHLQTNAQFSSKILHTLYWFGTKESLEQEIAHKIHIEHHNIKFVSIISGKYRRETPRKSRIKNIRDLFLFGFGIFQSLRYLLKYKIDVLFCKGGYVALPVVVAAFLLKRKIVVHESDTHAGLVNTIASKLGHKTFTAFENVLPGAEVQGQILSDDLILNTGSEDSLIKSLLQNLDHSKPLIIVTAGSQGSQRLYQGLIKALETDKTIQNDFNFILTLGKLNQDFKEEFSKYPNVFCFDFLTQKEMGMVYEKADIALTRAGTTSLAEQKLYDLKLLMIPISWTHDQYLNAKYYVQKYDDIMIDQKDEGFLNKLIMEIKRHKDFKKQLSQKDRLAEIRKIKEKIRNHLIIPLPPQNWTKYFKFHHK